MVGYLETSNDPLSLRYLKSDVKRFTTHQSCLATNQRSWCPFYRTLRNNEVLNLF